MIGRLAWLAGPALVTCVMVAAAAAQPPARPAAPAANVATPRTADGKPDLSGFWGAAPAPAGRAGRGAFATGPTTANENGDFISPMNLRNGDLSNLTNDGVISRRGTDNLPLYKPEFWEKVEHLDYEGNTLDPFNSCMPPSVPRMGPPRRIVQQGNELFFFHTVQFQRDDFRIIPIGPRAAEPDRDGSYMGSPAARWEGDTLVVETIGFNDASWFGPQGYFHGYELKVTEKFTRRGNQLTYESIVEDPQHLQRPWVRDTQTLTLNAPAVLGDAPPCSDRNVEEQVGKQREM